MTTIRVERRDRFTTVDRNTINDSRLSFRARGILVWLLDKPDGWRVRSDAIAAVGKEGRDAVRTALAELEATGYLSRVTCRDRRGRYITESVIRESPGQTGDGFPALDLRRPVSQAPLRTLRSKTEPPREFRNYDEQPLTPDQIAEKYGVKS